MPNTVILSAARTPVGKLGGGLSSLPATKLGAIAIEAALERAGVEPDQVQHVVMGQVLQAGQGQIPSRQAQIEAGIPKEVTSETINKVCASGVRAAGILDAAIRAGDLEVAVGRRHGVDVATRPTCCPKARFGLRMGDAKVLDAMVQDGLRNPFSGKQMFEEATEVGDELEMTRADMDRWALRSHERTIAATDDGRLPEEIVPVTISSRKGDTVGRGRRVAAPRHVARAAREAARPERARRARTPPATRRASTTAAARSCSPPRSGPSAQRQGGARHDHRPGGGGRRLRLPRAHARQRGQEGARQGRACSRATSTCGRSTRRSPP